MNAWRVRPLRRAMAASVVLAGVSLVCTAWVLGQSLQRRADQGSGALTASLQLASVLESERLQAALEQRTREVDGALVALLKTTRAAAPSGVPVSAVVGACGPGVLADGVLRAGVMEPDSATMMAFLERGEKGCVDRLWSLSVQALTGPPFPAPDELERLAQTSLFGMEHVEDGRTSLIGVYRDGIQVRFRYARADGSRAAWMDVVPAEVPAPPAVGGVRQDDFVTVGGVVAGYIHGGPGMGMVPAAVKRIKAKEKWVRELPDVTRAAASRAVLAWLFPHDSDDHDLALAAHVVTLESAVPLPVQLCTVSSAPWPAATARLQLLALFLLLAAAHVLLFALLTRRLARSLWTSAQQVRASWMVSHDAESDPSDAERAARLLEALAAGTRETLHAAFNGAARFWSDGPLQRLLAYLRDKAKPQ